MSEQETHFAGFAKLLWDELLSVRERGYIDVSDDLMDKEWNDEYRQIIAQRAYDLMFHAVKHSLPYQQSDRVIEYIVSHLPDLDAWPEYGEK